MTELTNPAAGPGGRRSLAALNRLLAAAGLAEVHDGDVTLRGPSSGWTWLLRLEAHDVARLAELLDAALADGDVVARAHVAVLVDQLADEHRSVLCSLGEQVLRVCRTCRTETGVPVPAPCRTREWLDLLPGGGR